MAVDITTCSEAHRLVHTALSLKTGTRIGATVSGALELSTILCRAHSQRQNPQILLMAMPCARPLKCGFSRDAPAQNKCRLDLSSRRLPFYPQPIILVLTPGGEGRAGSTSAGSTTPVSR